MRRDKHVDDLLFFFVSSHLSLMEREKIIVTSCGVFFSKMIISVEIAREIVDIYARVETLSFDSIGSTILSRNETRKFSLVRCFVSEREKKKKKICILKENTLEKRNVIMNLVHRKSNITNDLAKKKKIMIERSYIMLIFYLIFHFTFSFFLSHSSLLTNL